MRPFVFALIFLGVASGLARAQEEQERVRRGWLTDPRSAVLIVLGVIAVLGGGRKLYLDQRARRAVQRLDDQDVAPERIHEAAASGRGALAELTRLLTTAKDPAQRHAAGLGLARLWAGDELIAEEEKAIVTRGYAVDWTARRKYPRGLQVPIPIQVRFGLPFLDDPTAGIRPEQLEWSYRVTGTRRARLEAFSPWKPGPGRLEFTVVPMDFEGAGPHQLSLQARVRTAGLTDTWELELPHVPFSFELDPLLRTDALLTLPDADRGEAIEGSIRLVAGGGDSPDGKEPRLLNLDPEFTLQHPLRVEVKTPLTCDLAHRVILEIEGIPHRFDAGKLVISGQRGEPGEKVEEIEVGPFTQSETPVVPRPGLFPCRLILAADAELGWADPGIRSIWPGTITTEWQGAEVIRR